MPPTDERRRFQRAELHTQVTLEGESNFYLGLSEDISEGGLFVATYELRPLGAEVDVRFELPDGRVIHAIGVVRWVRDTRDRGGEETPGMGIQFASMSDEDRAAIGAFLAARAPMFYDE